MRNDDLVVRLQAATNAAFSFANESLGSIRRHLATSNMLCTPDPPLDVKFRIKRLEAIVHKLQQAGKKEGAPVINDFIGFRVLTIHIGCIGFVENAVMKWAAEVGLSLSNRHDSIETPDRGGYRSTHLDFVFLDASRHQLPSEASVEVQIETWLQHLHAMVSHRYFYKNKHASPALEEMLVKLSDDFYRADLELQHFDMIEQSRALDSGEASRDPST